MYEIEYIDTPSVSILPVCRKKNWERSAPLLCCMHDVTEQTDGDETALSRLFGCSLLGFPSHQSVKNAKNQFNFPSFPMLKI